MIRQLFKAGNSIVLSLPKEYLDALNLHAGEQVALELDGEKKRIIIEPVEKSPLAEVDPAFARQVDEFIEQYRPALEELAK